MRRSRTPVLPLAALAILATAAPSAAQESTTRGFVIGLHGTAASLTPELQPRRRATGGGIFVGYGVNRRITILAQADGAEFDDASTDVIVGNWGLGHFDLGVRFNFANSLRSFVPFLQGALGARAVTVNNPVVDDTPENKLGFSGMAVSLGGGVDLYFSEGFALDLSLLFSGGEFDTFTLNDVSVTSSQLDFDANSTRFNIGVVWWP